MNNSVLHAEYLQLFFLFIVRVSKVVRVWKDDDVYLEKAFKATVSEVKIHKDSFE